jgi:hypothetical protein
MRPEKELKRQAQCGCSTGENAEVAGNLCGPQTLELFCLSQGQKKGDVQLQTENYLLQNSMKRQTILAFAQIPCICRPFFVPVIDLFRPFP